MNITAELVNTPNYALKRGIYGASFHGEMWYKCPHCNHAEEIGGKPFVKKDYLMVYQCERCNKYWAIT